MLRFTVKSDYIQMEHIQNGVDQVSYLDPKKISSICSIRFKDESYMGVTCDGTIFGCQDIKDENLIKDFISAVEKEKSQRRD